MTGALCCHVTASGVTANKKAPGLLKSGIFLEHNSYCNQALYPHPPTITSPIILSLTERVLMNRSIHFQVFLVVAEASKQGFKVNRLSQDKLISTHMQAVDHLCNNDVF